MHVRMSRSVSLMLLAVIGAAAACSSEHQTTAPAATSAQLSTVATQFDRIGDSVFATTGNMDDAAPYYGAAAMVRTLPRIDSVTITIDSQTAVFNAIATELDISADSNSVCPAPPTATASTRQFICPPFRRIRPRTGRTLFAWLPGMPTKVVVLTTIADASPIGVPNIVTQSGDTTTIVTPAHLEYFDGRHASWWGTSGSQTSSASGLGTSCRPGADSTGTTDSTSTSMDRGNDNDDHGVHMPTGKCQLAQFTFAFTATVSAPPVMTPRNTATGTHTISLASSSLTGTLVTLAVGYPW